MPHATPVALMCLDDLNNPKNPASSIGRASSTLARAFRFGYAPMPRPLLLSLVRPWRQLGGSPPVLGGARKELGVLCCVQYNRRVVVDHGLACLYYAREAPTLRHL